MEPETMKLLSIPVETNCAVLYDMTDEQSYAICHLAESWKADKIKLWTHGAVVGLPEGYVAGALYDQNLKVILDFGVAPNGEVRS